jgi:hypothetical protein
MAQPIGPSTTNRTLAKVLAGITATPPARAGWTKMLLVTQRQLDAINEAQQRIEETPDYG